MGLSFYRNPPQVILIHDTYGDVNVVPNRRINQIKTWFGFWHPARMASYYHLNLNGLQLVFLIAAFFGIGFVFYAVLWLSIPSYTRREALLQKARAQQLAGE